MSVAKLNLQGVARAVSTAFGDRGTCVMGYDLLLDGERVVLQPAQGNTTCDLVYNTLINIMVDNGIARNRITRDYGVMD